VKFHSILLDEHQEAAEVFLEKDCLSRVFTNSASTDGYTPPGLGQKVYRTPIPKEM